MKTPADLKAARLRLGLSPKDAADLIGWPRDGDIDQLERAKVNVVWQDYAAALEDLTDVVEMMAEEYGLVIASNGTAICYSNDEDFREMEPGEADMLRYANVHRKMVADLQLEYPFTIIEFSRSLYRTWSEETGIQNVLLWARHRETQFESRPGLPTVKILRRAS